MFPKLFFCRALGLALGLVCAHRSAAESPREHLRLDANWKFHLGDDWPNVLRLDKAGMSGGPAAEKFDDQAWRPLDLPHDWAIELPFDQHSDDYSHGFKPVGPGFRARTASAGIAAPLSCPKEDAGKRIWLTFDGVFRDATVWVNGWLVSRHEGGYYPFREDITDIVHFGGQERHCGEGGREQVRGLVLRRRGHLPPRLAGQDRAGGHRARWGFCSMPNSKTMFRRAIKRKICTDLCHCECGIECFSSR